MNVRVKSISRKIVTKNCRFPAERVVELLSDHASSISDSSERANFVALTTPLRDSAQPYVKASGLPGSQRALSLFLELLRKWISVEQWFYDCISYADVVDDLRKANKDDNTTVLNICRSHSNLKGTSMIVQEIMSIFEEGSRVGDIADSSTKDVSIIGSENLAEAEPCLSEIGAMGVNPNYSSIALMARKFLLKESLPSIAKRQAKVTSVANGILNDSGNTEQLDEFMGENVPMTDILFPLLKESSVGTQLALVELYARKLYNTEIIKEISHSKDQNLFKFDFTTKPNESVLSSSAPMTSMTDLTRLVSQNSMSNLSSMGGESDSDGTTNSSYGSIFMHRSMKIPPNTPRTAAFKVINKLEEISGTEAFDTLLQTFPQYNKSAPRCQAGPINLLHIYVVSEELDKSSEDEFAKRCEDLLVGFQNLLNQADIRRVTLNVSYASGSIDDVEEYHAPGIFTFRANADFKEDSLFRAIEPSQAYHLDLLRVAKNFNVSSLASSQSPSSHVHLYKATPKRSSLSKDKKANASPRTFVRTVSMIDELTPTKYENVLVHALNTLDLSSAENPSVHPNADNHLYINLVSDGKVVLDAAIIEQIVVTVLKRYGSRISQLGLSEVETRITCCLSEESFPISIRMVASNPTGYVLVMNSYVEAADETNTKNIFKLIGDSKSNMSASGDSSWEGLDVTTPYPLTRPFDAQRKSATRSSDTLYCYDLPALFEAAVENQWSNALQTGAESGTAAASPVIVMYTSELVVQKKNGSGEWTMDDYSNGDLEMVQVQRGVGANDVGMVAWLMVLKTVEYPEVNDFYA